MRRDDKRQRSIHKQKIWPTFLANLLLSALLAVGGIFGVSAFAATLLSNSLRKTQDDMLACASLVNEYCADTLALAEAAVQSLDAPRTFDALFSLSGCDSAGWIGADGVTSRRGEALSKEEASNLYAQALGGGGVFPLASGGLAFTACLPGEPASIVYFADLGELALPLSAPSLWEQTDACLLIHTDVQGQPLNWLKAEPAPFDYAAIRASGLVYTPEKPVGRQELIDSGILQGGDMQSLVKGVLAAAGVPVPGENVGATVSLWFQNELNIPGCALMCHTRQPLDRFQAREILLFTALAAIIVMLPIFFMCATIIAKLVYNHGLKEAMLFDPVTGGNNFQYFKQRAARELRRKRYRNRVPAFAVIDMSRFRAFSDIHGQNEGELLLLRIYNSLSRSIHDDELITRYAIDQFSLMLWFSPDEDPIARMERMLIGLRKLYPGERLAYSVGVYLVTDRSQAVDRMHNFASVAKDAAKLNGGDGVALFTEAMRERLVSEQQLSSLMEKALKSREFVLYLQPKYAVNSRRLCGAEALVRWSSRERGFISPGDFIPLFEKNGFIMKLDEYMLGAVAEFQHRRLAAGKPVVPVSVNISRANFSDPAIARRIKSIVDRYGVPHELIELELTESAFFDDKTALLYTVRQLKRAGFQVSMDDFGSGYSSLNSLKDLPLDVVKLDKEFFNPTGDIDRSEVVIRDTIALAKKLDMTVVAEGIETEDQVKFLQTTSCDLIQGFYFAKPMPADEYETLVDVPLLP